MWSKFIEFCPNQNAEHFKSKHSVIQAGYIGLKEHPQCVIKGKASSLWFHISHDILLP